MWNEQWSFSWQPLIYSTIALAVCLHSIRLQIHISIFFLFHFFNIEYKQLNIQLWNVKSLIEMQLDKIEAWCAKNTFITTTKSCMHPHRCTVLTFHHFYSCLSLSRDLLLINNGSFWSKLYDDKNNTNIRTNILFIWIKVQDKGIARRKKFSMFPVLLPFHIFIPSSFLSFAIWLQNSSIWYTHLLQGLFLYANWICLY